MNLVKLTVDYKDKEVQILLNLEQIVSIKLMPHNRILIEAVNNDVYTISEEPYALRVFEELSKSAMDFSWQALIGEQNES